MLLITFEITVATALQGYAPLRNKLEGMPKKYSENFVDYFPPGKNKKNKLVSTQKLFRAILVHSKPFIKKAGICY